MQSSTIRSAFSLVELSIVLVILGLLVGGVLSGQSLIHASELRAATAEYQRYFTAVEAFKDKYFAIPGDFNNAQAFWGQSTACGGASATGVCNGNGDGIINQAAAVSTQGEDFMFWRELAFAGLVEGNYTGIAGPSAGNTGIDSVIGTNVPKSKMANSGWSVRNLANYAGDGATYKYDYGNIFGFGSQVTGDTTYGANMKPEDAWNIDTKLDDGLPGSGKIMVRDDNVFGTATACTNATGNTDYTSGYKLSNTALSCSFFIAKQF